jgi:hypothetical protein
MQQARTAPTWQTWWNELRAALRLGELAEILRGTLWLTCLTAILGHFDVLDPLDGVALMLLPDEGHERPLPSDGKASTLLLGITPNLFDREFGGHTPINRDRFQQLIEEVLAAYPNARVLAVDYDLSPGVGRPCDQNSENSVCDVAELEMEQQKRLEEFLASKFALPKGASLESCRTQLALITPLKHPSDLTDVERQWLQRGAESCIRFGHHWLLQDRLLGSVTHHLRVTTAGAPCSKDGDESLPLAAVVNKSRRCAGVDLTSAPALPGDGPELLNIAKAQRSMLTCALFSWSDIGDRCKKWLSLARSHPDAIDTIYIGAMYGEADKFATPVGDRFGMELHAFGSYSLLDPLVEEKVWSVVMDFALGISWGVLLGSFWGSALRYADGTVQRFFFTVAGFSALLPTVWLVMAFVPTMLQTGVWMNPLVIIAGLFMDSFARYLDHLKTGISTLSDRAHAAEPMRDAVRIFFDWPAVAGLDDQRIFRFCSKVVIYWTVVAFGLYCIIFA